MMVPRTCRPKRTPILKPFFFPSIQTCANGDSAGPGQRECAFRCLPTWLAEMLKTFAQAHFVLDIIFLFTYIAYWSVLGQLLRIPNLKQYSCRLPCILRLTCCSFDLGVGFEHVQLSFLSVGVGHVQHARVSSCILHLNLLPAQSASNQPSCPPFVAGDLHAAQINHISHKPKHGLQPWQFWFFVDSGLDPPSLRRSQSCAWRGADGDSSSWRRWVICFGAGGGASGRSFKMKAGELEGWLR